LPFVWDRLTLQLGLNFTLVTSLGDIDLLGEIPGRRNASRLKHPEFNGIGQQIFVRFCLRLRQLIRAKRAAGRPKDHRPIVRPDHQ
jgi:hypothetical protein